MSINSLSKYDFVSFLSSFPDSEKFWIACSGGMDSSVMLHLFYYNKSKIKQLLEIIYVNHGLQEKSVDWGVFCKKQCQHYDIPFKQLDISENCPKGLSIEEWAREKRYSLISQVMNKNDVLFTAHHQDDQVETFFLQALRGAGPRGLASMPSIKKIANGYHARPLLQYKRSEIQRYANDNNLVWQDDNSNSNIRYDRNYLRHKILPVIEERWPAYRETISRMINNQVDYKSLIDEIAHNDMKHALHKNTMSLSLEVIQKLSIERQKNLVFVWLDEQNIDRPGSKHISQIISDIICSTIDKSPCVNWKDNEVRRYRNLLYASKIFNKHSVNIEFDWNPESPLAILNETLIANPENGKGISKADTKNAKFVVRYRQGGEKIYPKNLTHSKTVKQLFQERGVLPWLRDRIPLIYINEKLAVIPGFCIDKKYAATKDESSWDIQWSGYDKVIQQ
ncbi:MAG: tRNA lysidine(34) synthetase TilS [Proteobacteria bacterium]|nr:tRNA lysidine(34) synthetase TilS [Pseudomonadota bacterium]